MRSLTLLLSFLFCQSLLFAQVEINVKLRSEQTALLQHFSNKVAGTETAPSAALMREFPFLEKVERVQGFVRTNKARQVPNGLSGLFNLRFDEGTVGAHLAALQQSGAVLFAEENRHQQLHRLEVDPPNDDSVSRQWYHDYIRTFDAWDITRGDAKVRVGIIDTGLDYDHPEFEGQIALNSAEDLNGNGTFEPWLATITRNGKTGDFDGIDNDQNGYTDDVIGYDFTDQPRSPFGGDFIDEDSDPLDDNSHGTVVAGIIHAKADNTIGGAGVAPDCKLVVLRAFGSSGIGEDDDIARAIIYAADNGIQVLNLSFGDIYPSRIMHEAIKYAYSRGVIMVASAGNGTGDELHYPSGFNEVISVSATTYDPSDGREFLWPLSAYGVTVDVSSPGSQIITPTLRDTSETGEVTAYGTFSGTSASAPMVAGTAALLLAHKGSLTPQQVRGILVSSTDDVSEPGWDHFTGAGRLNMIRALQTVGASHIQLISPVNDGGSHMARVPIIGTVLDPQFQRFHLEFQEGVEDLNDWQPILMDQTLQTKEDTLAEWDLRDLPDGEYTLRLQVERSNGFPVEDRIRFVKDGTAPVIEIKLNQGVWDNEVRKHLIIYRSSDQGLHTLHYRPQGSSQPFIQLANDRNTRNGEFLLGDVTLQNGLYEFYIEGTNLAGLTGKSPTMGFNFQADFVNRSGYDLQDYSLPMGRYLPATYDFNRNGFPEVVMSVYDRRLSAGKVKFLEFVGNGFEEKDSINFRPTLLPKDIADTDGNGLLELLASANDSVYILEQSTPNAFPKQQIYTNFDNNYFPAQFADTDDDGEKELLMKNFVSYYVFEGSGSSYQLADSMTDRSGNYIGSTAPRMAIGDFDGDGHTESVYGDFDGDILVYEHQANGYELTFVDTTALLKSASYLTQGDFDGDGIEELFVAVHTSALRNPDFEYDTRYWWLRIFKSTADNQYVPVWEDFLYDVDTDNLNAATAGNLDADPADELVFSTYPRTYIVDWNNGQYQMQWFLYGSLATHHIIGDFNGNGIGELGLGRGDTTFFWERDVATLAPPAVTSLEGIVLGPDRVMLKWIPSPGAVDYELIQWHVDSTLALGYTTPQSPFVANVDLISGDDYRYFMRASDGTNVSEFGNLIIRKPHPNNRVDSVEVINDHQIRLHFSWPVLDRESDKGYFVLNGEQSPDALIKTGDTGSRLILSFPEPFKLGLNSLSIDSLFLDADFGIFAPNHLPITFTYEPVEEDFLYLTRWEIIDEQTALLVFNYPLDESTLAASHFTIQPFGDITSVSLEGNEVNAIRVSISGATLGALGYPISITVATEVCAVNGVCIKANEGNTATFSSFREDLTKVYVYPNPVRPHQLFDGLRFANLTQLAEVRILTPSGRLINTLQETDGDGGLEWDMRDVEGQRLKPGVYLYHVTADGVKAFLGKFSVLE